MSLLSSSSRKLTACGFPANLPANSGAHEANFFIGAPKGVKKVREFSNEQPDGSVTVNRVVSYSCLVNIKGIEHCLWLNIRRTDFVEGGYVGDGSMESLLDSMLAAAMDSGATTTIPIVADEDHLDRNKDHVAGKSGVGYLA
tara:strand:- start:4766 stop:5191 length:426 start_codon:yes stop_codon:yes gene_type:complete